MNKPVLNGALGKAIRICIEKRFKTVDYTLLESPFSLRSETDNGWRCEFWGKILRSVVTAAWATGDPDLKKILDRTIKNMMATQTEDGCISSYPAELQLGGWDVWGRKYVLLALLRYYEMISQDPQVLECCCRIADHLMTQIGPEEEKKEITSCGQHHGLAASSILGAVVSLWRLTGNQKYRDFAGYIISRGCSYLCNVFDDIKAGILPSALGNSKAYELTSCIQGAVELEIEESTPGVREMAVQYYEAVRDHEIFVTGAGGAKDNVGEFWFEGALRQTRAGTMGLGETCVTATWIRFCTDMLRLTDDPAIADELEKSLYNGILGALAPDGSHWMHMNPTPLTGGGFKAFAPDQINKIFKTPFGGNDCCRAQGPEGLMTALLIAVTEKKDTLTVNLFEPLTFGPLTVSGNYPCDPETEISFTENCQKTLRLRTPEFLKKVTLNGKELPFKHGTYLAITRSWTPQDKIIMSFDFSLKEIPAPDGSDYVAVKRGPLVLAADSRGAVRDAIANVNWNDIPLCDYASAGNLFSEENTLTVWFKKE